MSFDFTLVAEREIQEAAEDGAFDNLPGKGKPLVLDNLPPHLRILKNANVPPDWIQIDQDIRRQREECARLWRRTEAEYRRRLAKSLAHFPATLAWIERTRTAYLRAIKQVNADILKLNMSSPSGFCGPVPYRVADETARFDAAFPQSAAQE